MSSGEIAFNAGFSRQFCHLKLIVKVDLELFVILLVNPASSEVELLTTLAIEDIEDKSNARKMVKP